MASVSDCFLFFKLDYFLALAIDSKPGHIRARVMAGGIEVLSLFTHAGVIDGRDGERLFINDWFYYPLPIRSNQAGAAIG